MKSWECIFLHMEGRPLKLIGNREVVIQSNPIILSQGERSNAGSRSSVFSDKGRLSPNTVHGAIGAPSPELNHFSPTEWDVKTDQTWFKYPYHDNGQCV